MNLLVPYGGMNRAGENDETRKMVSDIGCIHVVPLKSIGRENWKYNQQSNKRCNEVDLNG